MNIWGRGLRVVIVSSVIATAVVGAASHSGAVPSKVRHASPTGTGNRCSRQHPCSIGTAINDAATGDRIKLAAGVYGSRVNPLSQTLTDHEGALDIGGAGADRTTIYSDAGGSGAFVAVNATTFHDFELIYSGSGDAGIVLESPESDDATVANVEVIATGAASACEPIIGIIRDSLCVATGDGQAALHFIVGGNGTYLAEVQGVTAEATGSGGNGLFVNVTNNGGEAVTVVDSILSGKANDVKVHAAPAGAAAVSLAYSDFQTTVKVAGGGSESIGGASSNITAAPKFLDALHGNYIEQKGSPTVDAGKAVAGSTTDVLGNPRSLGSAPDIGAYEYLVKPEASKPIVTSQSGRSLHATVAVNPEGLSTSVILVARHGRRTIKSAVKDAGHGRKATSVSLVLHGLKRDTAYTVSALAKNNAGQTDSMHKTVHT